MGSYKQLDDAATARQPSSPPKSTGTGDSGGQSAAVGEWTQHVSKSAGRTGATSRRRRALERSSCCVRILVRHPSRSQLPFVAATSLVIADERCDATFIRAIVPTVREMPVMNTCNNIQYTTLFTTLCTYSSTVKLFLSTCYSLWSLVRREA